MPAMGRQALLADEMTPPSLLLLGPSGAGKSTLYRAALALAGELNREEVTKEGGRTRGLVRRVVFLPIVQEEARRGNDGSSTT